ncbi:MAG: hypothetical protein SFX73_01705 [Kofleriaceae bacterium]|nr:hypothetical protein [Kofleriaceae bacterium]
MRAAVTTLVLVVAACGDNNFATDAVDAAADATPDVAIDADPCPTDSVREIQAGTPGTDPSAYPAPGWWSADTRANGTVAVDDTLGVPTGFGCRSARFTTGETTGTPAADKAQLISFALAGTNLSSINTISYWAYRDSASTGGPAIALSLNVAVTGSTVPNETANLVYEPYQQSTGNAGILVDTWQHWDATATTPGDGLWWTSRIANPDPGSQANPQPWATFQALWSDAKVVGYGFNLGSYNPNMIVAGDGLVFGTTTTNF